MTRRNRSLLGLVAGAAALATSVLPMEVASAAATGGGTSWRINLSQTGAFDFDRPSTRARISGNGQAACYQSAARNVVTGDYVGPDIFWTDFSTPSAPVTRLVSVGANNAPANNQSTFCELSLDGNLVVFSTLATNLVQGSTAAGIFVRNMTSGAIRRIAGGERPVISDDGRFVAYNTVGANNSIRVTEINPQTLAPVPGPPLIVATSSGSGDIESLRPEISANGDYVVFASDLGFVFNDTNGQRDVYRVRLIEWRNDRSVQPQPELVSVAMNGNAAGLTSSRPGINGNGSVVSFESNSGNIANSQNGAPDTNGQTDAFVRDMPAGRTYLVSYRRDGTLGNSRGSRPQLDESGNIVAFVSTGAQIVSADTNNREDAFIRNWRLEQGAALTNAANRRAFLLAVGPNGESGACPNIPNVNEGNKAISTRPYLSNNGQTAVFVTGDCNLVPNLVSAGQGGPDTNLLADIYVRRYPNAP